MKEDLIEIIEQTKKAILQIQKSKEELANTLLYGMNEETANQSLNEIIESIKEANSYLHYNPHHKVDDIKNNDLIKTNILKLRNQDQKIIKAFQSQDLQQLINEIDIAQDLLNAINLNSQFLYSEEEPHCIVDKLREEITREVENIVTKQKPQEYDITNKKNLLLALKIIDNNRRKLYDRKTQKPYIESLNKLAPNHHHLIQGIQDQNRLRKLILFRLREQLNETIR